jgi:L-amino acid N-acyltransferase YncA
MKLEIRPATKTDYPAIAAIHNATWTDHPVLAEDLERTDAKRTENNFIERFMLELEGKSLAEGSFQNLSEHQFYLEINVLLEFQSRGFGSQFYAFLEAELERHKPVSALCYVREIHPFASRFVASRGFVEVLRVYHQTLQLSRFDAGLFVPVKQTLTANGYTISSFADLEFDPSHEQKLHELHIKTDADVPRVHPFVPVSFEQFKRQNLENPKLPKEACFIAIKNGEWVGLSQQRLRPDPTQLHTGMTGVLREHRGQGLALSLKLRAIEYATQHGFLELHSNNASTNVAMLAINKKLGFERSNAQIQLEKKFNQT